LLTEDEETRLVKQIFWYNQVFLKRVLKKVLIEKYFLLLKKLDLREQR
jgi:hypothetical protein